MITDSVILSKLTGNVNDIVLHQIDDVLQEKRILDKVPPIMKLVAPKVEPIPNGLYSTFTMYYNENYKPAEASISEVVLGDKIIKVEYKIYVVLKALLLSGVCRNEEIAKACRQYFSAILYTKKDLVDVKSLYFDVILTAEKAKSYFLDELSRAIVDSVYDERTKVEYKLLTYLQDYPDADKIVASINIKTLSDLESFLSAQYKNAKLDKFKRTRKGMSREEVALAYYIANNS